MMASWWTLSLKGNKTFYHSIFSRKKNEQLCSLSEVNYRRIREKILCFLNKTRRFVFLLNVLLTTQNFSDQLCYCEQNRKRCFLCVIKREFHSIEYDLYDNMFNLDFLGRIHTQLFDYLEKMFTSNRCVCLILNNKFY